MAPAARFRVNPTADNQSVFGFCPRPDKRLDLDLFARVLFLVAGVAVFLPVALFLLLVTLLAFPFSRHHNQGTKTADFEL